MKLPAPFEFQTADEVWQSFQQSPSKALRAEQSLINVRKWLNALVEQKGAKQVLLLGLDGISYSQMTRILGGRSYVHIIPVVSTVPSTSASAWTTILTGVGPNEHGIYGAAMYVPAIRESVFLFRPILQKNGVEVAVPLTRQHLFAPDLSTLFNDLLVRGFVCHALGFPNDLVDNGLVDFWLRGAYVHWLPNAYDLYDRPISLATVLSQQIESLIGSAGLGIFCYYNFDWFIHDAGITQELEATMRQLLQAVNSLRHKHPGLLVALVSDHGMLSQSPAPFSLLNEASVQCLSRMPPGGGGRILYFYPLPGYEGQMRKRLEELVGDSDEVLDRKSFLTRFYPAVCLEPERIGELIVVAHQSMFPGAMPEAPYEHGGVSQDEILAFFGWLD